MLEGAPELLNFAVLDAPTDVVASKIEHHGKRWSVPFRLEAVQNDWRSFFAADGNLHDIFRAEIFLFPLSQVKTAYVCNLADGWRSIVWNLVTADLIDAVYFRTATRTREYGIHEMEVLRSGETVRHIRTLQEDRWQFWNKGQPLAFESTDDFTKRPVRARYTLEHVSKHCREFGISIEQTYSHSDKGILITRASEPPVGSRAN